MTDLEAFYAGFAEGWHSAPKQNGLGGVYDRAYARGREARERDETGGDELPTKRKRVA